jgi:hypothetical protein
MLVPAWVTCFRSDRPPSQLIPPPIAKVPFLGDQLPVPRELERSFAAVVDPQSKNGAIAR